MYIHLYELEKYMEKSDIYDLISIEECEVEHGRIEVEFEQLDGYISQVGLYELAKEENEEDNYFEYLSEKLDLDHANLEDIKINEMPIEFVNYIYENINNDELRVDSILCLLSNNKLNIDKVKDDYIDKIMEYTIEDIFVYNMLEYEGYGRAEHYNGYEPTAINVADINIIKSEYSEYKDIIIKIFLEKFSNFCNCELDYEVEKQLKTKYPDISGYPYREDLVDEDNFEWYFIEECLSNWSLVFCDKSEAMYYYEI